jgi:UDP-glucose-4-epimerase GalE
MTRILVTGGAGYIGSHTAKRLARQGFEVAVFDNLSRGHRDFVRWGPLIEGDLHDTALVRETLRWFKPEAVIHFAAFAYVGESVSNPGLYYRNNVGGTLSLLEAMRQSGTRHIIVSSTCATYGQPDKQPIAEDAPQRPINPYGASKLMMEQLCADFGVAYGIKTVALRYFNASGCDPDGEIGERHDPEPHLIPRILMAATGELPFIEVFGKDYPTPDGTCIRDYIHVNDLADAHIAAARYLMDGGVSDCFNLGTGHGASVAEVIAAAEHVAGKSIPLKHGPRRDGDPAMLVADPSKAARVLNWRAGNFDLGQTVATAWNWHCREVKRRAQIPLPLVGASTSRAPRSGR